VFGSSVADSPLPGLETAVHATLASVAATSVAATSVAATSGFRQRRIEVSN
jgi:hypothetical protein